MCGLWLRACGGRGERGADQTVSLEPTGGGGATALSCSGWLTVPPPPSGTSTNGTSSTFASSTTSTASSTAAASIADPHLLAEAQSAASCERVCVASAAACAVAATGAASTYSEVMEPWAARTLPAVSVASLPPIFSPSRSVPLVLRLVPLPSSTRQRPSRKERMKWHAETLGSRTTSGRHPSGRTVMLRHKAYLTVGSRMSVPGEPSSRSASSVASENRSWNDMGAR